MANNTTVTIPKSVRGSVARLVIHTGKPGGVVFAAPFAPREVDYSGYEGVWNEITRPGRKPILTRAGLNMRKITMSLFVGTADPTQSVNRELNKLEHLAASKELLTIEYDPRCWGSWRISSLTYTSVERLPDDSNEITRATVEITFTEADDKGWDTTDNRDDKTFTRPKTYVIVAGDTLGGIARMFYDNPAKWIKIADANPGIKPKALKPGSTIRLP
jgi:nucleoid-associated protein YgaU